eukprot:CAMPEP_0202066356 /NCGR_PEP_ID=MMETSP0963-20130614/53765_1 /ASSEMBLY_ACC=CAM_ASM_000494 /TAXON_ID=4773 /ORGANISM="Schizochytrium aggregatum, Strain ATCC28209" /LENGTH=63 /DNA_ID=CAMNT_0048633051 /DNA_START=43 /DNA_END=234 /DNA_ORIENTATION=-
MRHWRASTCFATAFLFPGYTLNKDRAMSSNSTSIAAQSRGAAAKGTKNEQSSPSNRRQSRDRL